MKITPVAADSMGTRSMATFVDVPPLSVMIDPGADLAKLRFGHAPHQLEEYQLEKHLERIQLYIETAKICVLTRYIRTHCFMDHAELFEGKVLMMKNPNRSIRVEERKTAFDLLKRLKSVAREVIYIDGRTFEIGSVRFGFSDPVEITDDGEAAYTVMTAVRSQDRTLVHTSCCQGLDDPSVRDFIQRHTPDVLYLDGPPLYHLDTKDSQEGMDRLSAALENLYASGIEELILDHHFVREQNWRNRMDILAAEAEKRNVRLRTAAEFRGEENNPFESRRNRLYERGE